MSVQGGDMPADWDAAQRFLGELRSFGPQFTGESHPLSVAEAREGPGRLYVRCERLSVEGYLLSYTADIDECVVHLSNGRVKVPRTELRVLEVKR